MIIFLGGYGNGENYLMRTRGTTKFQKKEKRTNYKLLTITNI